MRQSRSKSAEPLAYYHCISRVVDRRFALGDEEKEQFVKLMRGYELFCGVRVVTYCVMSNHFHILLEVPKRPAAEDLPDDAALVSLLRKARHSYGSATLAQDLARFRERGQDDAAEELRERFLGRMWDVSWFMKVLKQRFTQWFNRRHERRGTLWEDRFKSVLIEGAGRALATMAAYIDLNPIRAGMVSDPKEYRWCGYAEAEAGNKRARQGLAVAVEAAAHCEVAANQVMKEFQRLIYAAGEEGGIDESGRRIRKGFGRAEVESMLARGGKLGIAEALRCRVRYFSDGAVLGSREFVNGFFVENRWRFGPKRKDGARRMSGVNLPDLFSLRQLKVNPVSRRHVRQFSG